MRRRCSTMYASTIGSATSTAAAAVTFGSAARAVPEKNESASGAVCTAWFSGTRMSASRNSFQVKRNRIVHSVAIAGPAIATLATILFLFTWNEFLLALILVPENQAVQTAPLALSFFSGTARSSDPTVTAAAAVLVALPIVLAYVVLQRRLITGLVAGAVK